MKSIKGWNKWFIHPFTIIYLLVAFISGNLYSYLSALVIVCIHECGHYYMAKKCKFDIDKIEIFPFGAFLSLNDYGIHHIVEEMLVVMAGPVMHLFIYLVIKSFDNSYLLEVNRLVLLFNLLPIYPLDGSKLVLLFISLFCDYQRAVKRQIKISVFSLVILIINNYKIGYILIYCYLLYLNYYYIINYRYDIIRLYLSRKDINLYHRIKINKKLLFYRPFHNYYVINNITYDEKDMIKELIENM